MDLGARCSVWCSPRPFAPGWTAGGAGQRRTETTRTETPAGGRYHHVGFYGPIFAHSPSPPTMYICTQHLRHMAYGFLMSRLLPLPRWMTPSLWEPLLLQASCHLLQRGEQYASLVWPQASTSTSLIFFEPQTTHSGVNMRHLRVEG